MITFRRVLFLFVVASMLTSCFGIKLVGGSGPSGKLYEEFYTKEGATMYFINKLKYKTQKSFLEVDFTFKDFGTDTTGVIANHTVYLAKPEKIKSISLITSTDKEFRCSSTENLYVKNNKLFSSRNSSKFNYRDLYEFFKHHGEIKIETNESNYIFIPANSSLRKAEKIFDKVFKLIEIQANT